MAGPRQLDESRRGYESLYLPRTLDGDQLVGITMDQFQRSLESRKKCGQVLPLGHGLQSAYNSGAALSPDHLPRQPFDIYSASHQDHRYCDIARAQLLNHVDAIEARHRHVADDQLPELLLAAIDSILAVDSLRDCMAGASQQLRNMASVGGNLVQRTVTLAARAFGTDPVRTVATGDLAATGQATRTSIDADRDRIIAALNGSSIISSLT